MTNIEAIVKKCNSEDQVALNEWVSFTANTVRENNHLKQKLATTAHELRVLKRLHYAATSEKIALPIYSQEMLPLFNDFELVADQIDSGNAPAEAPDAESEEKAALPREKSSEDAQQRGRKPLLKTLPRTIVEHDLPDAQKTCQCGEALTCFGVTTCEQLRYQPARFEVIEHRCKKYGCTACNAKNKIDSDTSAVIRTAQKPLSILPKSIATPELLTQVLLNKFSDALPLYRQEAIFSRAGIDLSRQTLSNWILRVSKHVIPVVNLLQEWIVETSIAFADETPLQVLHEPNRRPQNTSYMWCFIGLQSDKAAIAYQYHPSRSGQIPRDFFDGFTGASIFQS